MGCARANVRAHFLLFCNTFFLTFVTNLHLNKDAELLVILFDMHLNGFLNNNVYFYISKIRIIN